MQELRHFNVLIYVCIGVTCVILSVFFTSNLRIDMKQADYGMPIVSLFVSVSLSAIVAMIAILCSKVKFFSATISLLGEASMVIMYLHIPLRDIIVSPYRNEIVPDSFPWVYLLWAVIVGLIIPTMLYLIISNITPLKKILLGKY